MNIPPEFINPTKIIDTSYVVYYVMFSTWNWFKNEFDVSPDPLYDPMTEKEFCTCFKNKFKSNIERTAKSLYKMSTLDNTIFALDAPKNCIWRNEFNETYKLERKQRDKSDQEFSYSGAFNYVKNILIPNIMDEYKNVKLIEHSMAEGDDVIAICAKELPETTHKLIIATDRDLGQLLSIPNTRIISLQQKELTCLGETEKVKKLVEANYTMTPKDLLLQKILVGDKADGIQSIVPRMGPGTAAKYILDKNELKKFLDDPENIDAKIRFRHNQQLIDFKFIPEEIVANIKEQLFATTDPILQEL